MIRRTAFPLAASLASVIALAADGDLSQIQRDNRAACEFAVDPSSVIREAKMLERAGRPMEAHARLQEMALHFLRRNQPIDPLLSQELDRWRGTYRGQWREEGVILERMTPFWSSGQPTGLSVFGSVDHQHEDGRSLGTYLLNPQTLERRIPELIDDSTPGARVLVTLIDGGPGARIYDESGQHLLDMPQYRGQVRMTQLYWLSGRERLLWLGQDHSLHLMDRNGQDRSAELGDLAQKKLNFTSPISHSSNTSVIALQEDGSRSFEVWTLSDFRKVFSTADSGITQPLNFHLNSGTSFYEMDGMEGRESREPRFSVFLTDSTGRILESSSKQGGHKVWRLSNLGGMALVVPWDKTRAPYLRKADGSIVQIRSNFPENCLAARPLNHSWSVGDRYLILWADALRVNDRHYVEIIDTATGDSIRQIEKQVPQTLSIDHSPDETFMAIRETSSLALFSYDGTRIGQISLPGDYGISHLVSSSDSNWIWLARSHHDRQTRGYRLTLRP